MTWQGNSCTSAIGDLPPEDRSTDNESPRGAGPHPPPSPLVGLAGGLWQVPLPVSPGLELGRGLVAENPVQPLLVVLDDRMRPPST